jgi:hypothetical protein
MSLSSLSEMAKLNAAALLVAAVGIVIQIIGGIDYPVVPPGLVILVVAAGLVTVERWSWAPFVGVLVPLFLLVGGAIAIANEDEPNRTDFVPLIGTIVEATGIIVALIAGLQVVRQLRRHGA